MATGTLGILSYAVPRIVGASWPVFSTVGLLKYPASPDISPTDSPYAHSQARLHMTALPLKRPCVVSNFSVHGAGGQNLKGSRLCCASFAYCCLCLPSPSLPLPRIPATLLSTTPSR